MMKTAERLMVGIAFGLIVSGGLYAADQPVNVIVGWGMVGLGVGLILDLVLTFVNSATS